MSPPVLSALHIDQVRSLLLESTTQCPLLLPRLMVIIWPSERTDLQGNEFGLLEKAGGKEMESSDLQQMAFT